MKKLSIILEYKDNKDQLFKKSLSVQDYFDDYEGYENCTIESVPKYLSLKDYVELPSSQLKYIKITITNTQNKNRKVHSMFFLHQGKSTISLYSGLKNKYFDSEIITNIQISDSPKTIQSTRIELKNEVPFLRSNHLIKINEDGSEEYLMSESNDYL